MPEDIAIMSSKSDVDPCSHGRDPDHQKVQTDRQTAFQLYIIVDKHPQIYVTRSAKTDHVRTKIEIRFFGPANSCTQL